MAGEIFVYEIDSIPDAEDQRLAMICGGNVRERVFQGFEHILRIISQFTERQISLALRYRFNPESNGNRQKRLRLLLAVNVVGINPDIVRQLIEGGPLSELLGLNQLTSSTKELEVNDLPCACEILRQEERIEAQLPREFNKYVPSAGFYYSPAPLQPREDNDYVAIDSLLSRINKPCSIELLVSPVDHTPDMQAHEKYIRQLMAINGYGEDVFVSHKELGSIPSLLPDDPTADKAVAGNIRKKDPTADEILREQQELHRNLRQPQLLFNVRAFAVQPEIALMLASTVAECGLLNGKYRLISYEKGGDDKNWLEKSIDATRQMEIALHVQYPPIWSQPLPEAWKAFQRISHLATVDEIKGLFRIPVGGYNSPRCIRKSTDPTDLGSQKRTSILIGDDLETGEPPNRKGELEPLDSFLQAEQPKTLELRLPLKVFTKHLFIAGVPGSGKTTAVFNLLVQLFRNGIPFLVIEPAKTEYRTLKILGEHPDPGVRRMAREIRVYTPGNELISPLRFNPLSYPAGITLDEHIGTLLDCFQAAMPMEGPLHALVAESVEAAYSNRSNGRFPQMDDLLESARQIMTTKGYDGEIKGNLQAAIEVRLGLLTRRTIGRLFRTSQSIPDIGDILEHPTIIEMDYLPQNHACLLTLFILSAVREHIRISPGRREAGLHHVTVIEEAHNIVGRTGEARASGESADPRAHAAQYVSRMLAELRALGESLIIADQLPSTVAPEVIKNTGSKLAHRLVSNDDRGELGGAMLMSETAIEEMARLSPGTAYLYTDGFYRPRKVQCLHSEAYLGLVDTVVPVGKDILPFIRQNDWFISDMEMRGMVTLARLEEKQNLVATTIQMVERELSPPGPEQLLAKAISSVEPELRQVRLESLFDQLSEQLETLRSRFENEYLKASVEPELSMLDEMAIDCPSIKDRLDQFLISHNDVLEPRYQSIINTITDLRQQVAEELLSNQGEQK